MKGADYPHGWCGYCNRPAVGVGKIPLPSLQPSNTSVKVCRHHIDRVVDLQEYVPEVK